MMYRVVNGLVLGTTFLGAAAIVFLCLAVGAGLFALVFETKVAAGVGGMAGLIFGIGAVVGFWMER